MNTEYETQNLSESTLDEPKHATGAVAIMTAVVGGILVLGLGTAAVVSTVFLGPAAGALGTTGLTDANGEAVRGVVDAQTLTVDDLAGVRELEIEVDAAALTVEYGDVEAATLHTTGVYTNAWRFERDGDELVVRSPGVANGGGTCVFGMCPPAGGAGMRATLTLPQELQTEELDADMSVGAGRVTADGNYGHLSIDVGVGEAKLTGTARSVTASVDVGSLTLDLENTDTADVSVEVGDATVLLGGTAPQTVSVDVELGSAALTVPRGDYRVVTKNDLGTIRNSIGDTAGAKNRVEATVSLGTITLDAAQ